VSGADPQGDWWQDDRRRWRRGGRPDSAAVEAAPEARRSFGCGYAFVRFGVGLLLALVGALVGIGASAGLTYWLLSGQGVNALVWFAGFVFFCFLGIPLGIALALLLGRRLWPG
jgi:hypothetical protein